ncbi:MAG: hypothetical protein WBP59_04385 [Ilumatobacteraceae bacterium]
MLSPLRLASVALAATLLIAACGSDDDASTDTTVAAAEDTTPATTPETTPETTDTTEAPATTDGASETTEPTETQDVEADTAAAQAALLTIADLPEGWTEAAAGAESEINARLAECAEIDSVTSADASASTGYFTSADGGLVMSQSIGVQPTEQDARMVVAFVATPAVPDCIAAAYTELGAAALSPGAIADDAEIGEVTAARLAVGSAGDATQAIRVVIPVTTAGVASQVTVDHVLTRTGRSVSIVAFEGLVAETPVETIDELNAVAASRLPA